MDNERGGGLGDPLWDQDAGALRHRWDRSNRHAAITLINNGPRSQRQGEAGLTQLRKKREATSRPWCGGDCITRFVNGKREEIDVYDQRHDQREERARIEPRYGSKQHVLERPNQCGKLLISEWQVGDRVVDPGGQGLDLASRKGVIHVIGTNCLRTAL